MDTNKYYSLYLEQIMKKKCWMIPNLKAFLILSHYYPDIKFEAVTKKFFNHLKEMSFYSDFLLLIQNAKYSELYQSKVHGYKHVLNVCLFSYLIALNQRLNIYDLNILLTSAIYHDIGRNDDYEDAEHGKRGAFKIDMVLNGFNRSDLNFIKALIHSHSLPDKENKSVIEYYQINKSEQTRCLLLMNILKDADALDRFRLSSTSLKIKYLRLDYSIQLIPLALTMSFINWEN